MNVNVNYNYNVQRYTQKNVNQNRAAVLSQNPQVNFTSVEILSNYNKITDKKLLNRYMSIINTFVKKAKNQKHDSFETKRYYAEAQNITVAPIEQTNYYKDKKLIHARVKNLKNGGISNTYYYEDKEYSGSVLEFNNGRIVDLTDNSTNEKIELKEIA